MKIRTDVNEILSQRAQVFPTRIHEAAVIRNTSTRQVGIPQSGALAERLNTERSLNDALNLAIMSQNIIQKAMMVTSRLRSIASEAFTGGRINASEVQTAMADIKASLQVHGERISAPPQMSSTPFGEPRMPAVSGDLEAVLDIAQGMRKGNIPASEVFHGLMERLNARLEELNSTIQTLQGGISKVTDGYPSSAAFNPPRAIQVTSALITGNPQTALGAQGYISRENAGRILSA